MLLECSSCAKMYRVREGAANPPKTCPACQGALRPAGSAAPAPSGGGQAEGRQKDLESKLEGVERELTAVKASAELKDKELQEAQASIARLGSDLEKAQAAYREALKKKEQELEAAQAKAKESEAEGTKVRQAASAQTMALLKAKDEALRQAQDRVAELEAAASAPAVPSAELEEARRSIALLGEDLAKAQAAYKEALKKKDDEIEELHRKLAAAPAGPAKPAGSPDSELQRAVARASGLERIVQDGERRYTALQRQLEALQEKGASGAQAALQDRVKELERDLENARRDYTNLKEEKAAVAPPAPASTGPRLSEDLKTRIGEARYLSADLDRTLASVTSSLTGLVERMKRLDGTLQSIPPELLAAQEEAKREETEETPAVEESVEFGEAEPPPAEPEAPPELSASEEEGVQPLESLPDPEPSPEGSLPADETLLDMGGARRPAASSEEEEPAAEAPAEGDAPSTERPTRRGARIRPREADKKKSGFFGKLFGKK